MIHLVYQDQSDLTNPRSDYIEGQDRYRNYNESFPY
jgi:hypothetical protein